MVKRFHFGFLLYRAIGSSAEGDVGWQNSINLKEGRGELWRCCDSLLTLVAGGSCVVMHLRAVSRLNNNSICLFLVIFCTRPQQRGEIKDYHAPKCNFCYQLSWTKILHIERWSWFVSSSLWSFSFHCSICSCRHVLYIGFLHRLLCYKQEWTGIIMGIGCTLEKNQNERIWKFLSPHGTEAK